VIDLEIELGVQLLNRTTQSATPTEVGHRYYERCLVILAEIENAETSVSQFQVEAPGLLRVNAPMSFGTMFLGRLMGQFMAHHPDLQIELVLSDRRPAPDSRVTRSPNEIEQTTEPS
jgi:DNA-binding transcriptional LysR family regulator